MITNNNLSVLPFYTSIDEQNHRKSYAYGDVYPLYAHTSRLPPFQIIRDTRSSTTFTVTLYKKDGTAVGDITTEMESAGLQVVRFESLGYDIIVFTSSTTHLSDVEVGQYYIILSDGTDTWYSDIITLVADVSAYLRIEWACIENMTFDDGQIVYTDPTFTNILYLATELGKPEYSFEEEGEQRNGYFFPEKQISEKVYKFQFLASEYLCDVMRLIRMCDYIRVRDKFGNLYRCDQFLMTPKWETQGNIASVEVEFHTDTVVKKIGTGYELEDLSDFNSDYNDDYTNP